MQSLSLYRVQCPFSDQYNTEQALSNINIIPNWNYASTRAIANFLYSYDKDIYTSSTITEKIEDITGIDNENIRIVRDIDLKYNAPAKITTTETSQQKTINQVTEIQEGNITTRYTFIASYTFATGEFSFENSSYMYNSTTGEVIETIVTPNDDGTTTVNTTTENPNGTTTTSQQDYNEDGTIVHDQSTTINPDGSSVSSSTNYDENGNPTDGENQWIDTSGNENTQTIEYNENGDPYITGYEIDTTNNPNGGENLTQPIDTGVLAFDGRDFDIYLKCKFYWNRIQYASGTSTKMNPILNFSANDENNKVNGFLITFISRGSLRAGNTWWNFSGTASTSNYATIMRVLKYIDDRAGQTYHIQKSPGTGNDAASGIGAAQNATGSDICVMNITCRNNVFHIGVTNESGTLQTVCQSFNKSPYTNQDLDFGSSLFSDVTVELGHWDSVVDNVQYSFNYEVLEFDIHKL